MVTTAGYIFCAFLVIFLIIVTGVTFKYFKNYQPFKHKTFVYYFDLVLYHSIGIGLVGVWYFVIKELVLILG